MKKRNYIITFFSEGNMYTDLYNTFELIVTLIIANFKKDYEIISIERGEFFDD